MTLLGLVVIVAQLTPAGGNALPLPSNGSYVPPSVRDGYVRTTLPAWLARHQVVRVRHGTEVFRVSNSRVTWTDARGRHAATVPAVVGVRRSPETVVVEAIGGEHRFPADAEVVPTAGQYTLIFYAPGHLRSPLLRYASPDYVVP